MDALLASFEFNSIPLEFGTVQRLEMEGQQNVFLYPVVATQESSVVIVN